LRVYSGMQEEAVSAFAAVCSRGLVLEAFGIGSLPFSILEVVRNAISRDVPVIITSQAAQGWTAPVYGFPGGGKYLEQMGCVFAGWLSGRKARLLLMAALSAQSGVNLTAVYAPYN
jgi:L-asparaginase